MSRLLRVLRLLQGTLALLLVLLAGYVSLGRELLPLVGDYRSQVEAQLAERLPVALAIGQLSGRWQGLQPVLVAQDVHLGEGQDALYLQQLRLRLDIPASLWARRLVLGEVQLDGLRLHLQQAADGRWALAGLPSAGSGEGLAPAAVLRGLEALGRLTLLDSQLLLQPRQGEPLSLNYVELSLTGGTRPRLDARLHLPDGQPLALSLDVSPDAGNWQASAARFYLSLPHSDWAQWLPAGLIGDWQIEQLQAGGELWLEWAQGRAQRAALRLNAPLLRLRHANKLPQQLESLDLSLHYRGGADGGRWQLDGLAFEQDGQRFGPLQAQLTQQAQGQPDERWQLLLDRLPLQPLGPLALALAPLRPLAVELLESLQPRGQLANLQLNYWPQHSGPGRLDYALNLQQVGVSGWRAVPALENTSGSLRGDLGGGELRASSRAFGLQFTHLFQQMWHYQQAQARLRWSLDEQAFTLHAPFIRVHDGDSRIGADFLLRLFRDPQQESYLDLRVGLADGDALQAGQYLPTLAPAFSPALAEWLNTAIRGGRVRQGWFQYQGALARNAEPEARHINLYFDTEQAELAFQPGWPLLREVQGEVLIEGHRVQVRAPAARLLGSQLSAVQVEVAAVAPGQPLLLTVDGRVQADLADALKILQEAPIGTAEVFAGWQGQGALDGRLQLQIPLARGAHPRVLADFSSQAAQLTLAQPALALSEIRGAFRFDSEQGLSAPDIRARALGHALRGSAHAEGSAGQPRTRIQARGTVALPVLSQWLGVSVPLPLEGRLPYQLELILQGEDSQLRVDSDLQGLAVQLPEPFAKAAGHAVPSRWRMTLAGAERRYWLDYGELLRLDAAAAAGGLSGLRGEIRLGGAKARLPGTPGLRLNGRLESFDWAAWQRSIEPYRRVQGSGELAELFKGAELALGRFDGFGMQIDALQLQLTPTPAAWQLQLDSPLLGGRIALPKAAGEPISVDLHHLRLPASSPSGEEQTRSDPLQAVVPADIPGLDVRIEQVMQGDSLLGRWAFKARPLDDGVRFSELALQLKGLEVQGEARWQGPAGDSQSSFSGRISGTDLAQVLPAWGYAPSLSSERFRLNANGQWPGSPAWFALERYSGRLDASLRHGAINEVQGAASALRVFGLLNFDSIGRRLRLDFSDLLGKGFAYDTAKVLLEGRSGVFETLEPLRVVGPSSSLEMSGRLDLRRDLIDARLQVSLPVTNNLPLAALIAGAPAVGGALFIVDKLLGDTVSRFASVQYRVEGHWKDPQISLEKPFERKD